MLRLPDEAWRKIANPVDIPTEGPAVTGDPIVDEWERRLFEAADDE